MLERGEQNLGDDLGLLLSELKLRGERAEPLLARPAGGLFEALGDELERDAAGGRAEQAQYRALEEPLTGKGREHAEGRSAADARQRVERRELQQAIGRAQDCLEGAGGLGAPDLAEGLGRGDPHVLIRVAQGGDERGTGRRGADVAEHVGGELADIAVLAPEAGGERGDSGRTDPRERLGGRVPRPRVVGVREPLDQRVDSLGRVWQADQPLDGRLAHAPALVGEPRQQGLEVRTFQVHDGAVAHLGVRVTQALARAVLLRFHEAPSDSAGSRSAPKMSAPARDGVAGSLSPRPTSRGRALGPLRPGPSRATRAAP